MRSQLVSYSTIAAARGWWKDVGGTMVERWMERWMGGIGGTMQVVGVFANNLLLPFLWFLALVFKLF